MASRRVDSHSRTSKGRPSSEGGPAGSPRPATRAQDSDSDLDAALALQERVRALRSEVTGSLERVEAARRGLAGRWLARKDPPLWRALEGPTELAALGEAIVADLSSVWAELVAYAPDRRETTPIQVASFLVLAYVLSRVRARRDRRRGEPAATASDALRHPWVAALLIAVLLTPFLQPERVRGVVLVVGPVALVAWYVVLAGLLPRVLRRPLAGLAALSLLEMLRLALIEVPAVDRALLTLELAAGLAGVLWLRRPARLQQIPRRAAESAWLRLLGRWMALVAAALGVGLGAALLGYTGLADGIATLAIWGTLLGAAWLALVRIAEELAEDLVEEGALAGLRMVRSGGKAFLRVLRPVLRGAGLFAWVHVTLGSVGLWSPARSGAAAVLSYPVGYGSVTLSFGAIVAFGLTLWISWLVARFLAFALDQELFSRVRLSPGVPFALATFTRYVILVIGFVVALGALGFSLDRVTLLLSALGVGIGFGLQNVVNNFVSGAILLFERPVRGGDWIQLGDLMGTVSKIGLRASTVRTLDGADMIVPNGDLVSARVVNWTLSEPKWRIIVPVGVAYGTKPRRVLELLEEVARSHPDVLEEPEPVALFRGFGESALNFELRIFTGGSWLKVASDLTLAVSEALEKAGVTIPFPQRDLHFRNADALRDALGPGQRRPGAADRAPGPGGPEEP